MLVREYTRQKAIIEINIFEKIKTQRTEITSSTQEKEKKVFQTVRQHLKY